MPYLAIKKHLSRLEPKHINALLKHLAADNEGVFFTYQQIIDIIKSHTNIGIGKGKVQTALSSLGDNNNYVGSCMCSCLPCSLLLLKTFLVSHGVLLLVMLTRASSCRFKWRPRRSKQISQASLMLRKRRRNHCQMCLLLLRYDWKT